MVPLSTLTTCHRSALQQFSSGFIPSLDRVLSRLRCLALYALRTQFDTWSTSCRRTGRAARAPFGRFTRGRSAGGITMWFSSAVGPDAPPRFRSAGAHRDTLLASQPTLAGRLSRKRARSVAPPP